MDKQPIHDLVAKLHTEMSDALRTDPKSKESLRDMQRDIDHLIENHGATPQVSLADRLEEIAIQFEAAHPTLAASARRLVDLLSEVGI